MDLETFLFADLAGYTALTEAHGDDEAADLVGEFVAAVRVTAVGYDAEVVKSIGDAVMLRCRDAGQAVRLAMRLVCEVGGRHGNPIIRIGMHTGPAVQRDGDWFGATVNIAARVAALAAGGEVLLTEATRAELGELHGVDLVARGAQTLKNVRAPVALYAAIDAAGCNAGEFPVDPVCRMVVDPARSAGTLLHAGTRYWFCSLRCAQQFTTDPDAYAGKITNSAP